MKNGTKTFLLLLLAVCLAAGASLWGKLKSGIGWISLDYVQRV